MVAVGGKLFAVEPNHGELEAVSLNGEIHRVADISATQGRIVPTSVAFRGNFFVGNLGLFPIVEGSSKVLEITPGGQVTTVVSGLTTVLGVALKLPVFGEYPSLGAGPEKAVPIKSPPHEY